MGNFTGLNQGGVAQQFRNTQGQQNAFQAPAQQQGNKRGGRKGAQAQPQRFGGFQQLQDAQRQAQKLAAPASPNPLSFPGVGQAQQQAQGQLQALQRPSVVESAPVTKPASPNPLSFPGATTQPVKQDPRNVISVPPTAPAVSQPVKQLPGSRPQVPPTRPTALPIRQLPAGGLPTGINRAEQAQAQAQSGPRRRGESASLRNQGFANSLRNRQIR